MNWNQLQRAWPFLVDARIVRVERSENTTWLLRCPAGGFALRRYRDGYSNVRSIRAELGFMRLARVALGTGIPEVFATSSDDEILRTSDGTYVLFSLIEGIEASHDDMARIAPQLGEVTATLHASVQESCQLNDWEPDSRWTWDLSAFEGSTPRWGAWQSGVANGDEQLLGCLGAAYEEMQQRLGEASRETDSFGLIHADLRAANLLLVDSNLVGIIDFDDCGFGWFVYDAVTMLSFYEARPGSLALLDGWVTGYQRILNLDITMLNLVPSLVIYRRLLLTAWLHSHPHASVPGLSRSNFGGDTATLARRYLEAPEDIEYLLS
jgi:Ser/Thr protein kinase RdoA (MazF antagonist)